MKFFLSSKWRHCSVQKVLNKGWHFIALLVNEYFFFRTSTILSVAHWKIEMADPRKFLRAERGKYSLEGKESLGKVCKEYKDEFDNLY